MQQFSQKEITRKRTGIYAIDKIPTSLTGRTLRILKVANIYHSGNISSGVTNGSANSDIL